MTYTKHARVGFVTEECEYSAGFCRVFHLFVRIVVDKDAIYKRNLKNCSSFGKSRSDFALATSCTCENLNFSWKKSEASLYCGLSFAWLINKDYYFPS